MQKPNWTIWIIVIVVILILNVIAWVLFQKHIWITNFIPFIAEGILLGAGGVILLIVKIVEHFRNEEEKKKKGKVLTMKEARELLIKFAKEEYAETIKYPFLGHPILGGEEGKQVQVMFYMYKTIPEGEKVVYYVCLEYPDKIDRLNRDTRWLEEKAKIWYSKSLMDEFQIIADNLAPTKSRTKKMTVLTQQGMQDINYTEKKQEKTDALSTDKKEEKK